MTAVTETEAPVLSEEALAEIFEAIDNLDDSTAVSVISFLPDEVDDDIPLPEEVNEDPREALKAVARKHPVAVADAATNAALALLFAEAFSIF